MVQQVSSPIRSSSAGFCSPITVPTIVITPCELSKEPFPYMSAEKGPVYPYQTSERRLPKKELRGKTIRWVLIVIVGLLVLLSQVVTKPDLFPYKDIQMSTSLRSTSMTSLLSPSVSAPLSPSEDLTSSASSKISSNPLFRRFSSLSTSFSASFGSWDVSWSKEKETPITDSFSVSLVEETVPKKTPLEHGRWSLMGRPTHHSLGQASSKHSKR